MGLLEDLASAAERQAALPHSHIGHIQMYYRDENLICGSVYFNDGEFTAGFDRAELVAFQRDMNEGINKALARKDTTADAQATTPCILCKTETTPTNAFQTILGWLHFECHADKENYRADSQSATPGP